MCKTFLKWKYHIYLQARYWGILEKYGSNLRPKECYRKGTINFLTLTSLNLLILFSVGICSTLQWLKLH